MNFFFTKECLIFLSLDVVVFPSVCRKSFCSRIISPVLSDVRHMPSRNTIIGHFSCRKIQRGFKQKETIKTKIKQYIKQKSLNAGGQIASATAAATFKIRSILFCKMYFLAKCIPPPPPSFWQSVFSIYILYQKKKLGFEILSRPPERDCYLWGDKCCAGIEVLIAN